jgi:cytochrome c5
MAATNRNFLKAFLLVVIGLNAWFFGLIVLAYALGERGGGEAERKALVEERTAPFGTVITDPAALAKLTAAAAPRAPMSGDQIVAQVCSSCHASGVLGAPKIGDASDWKGRFASQGGLNGLLQYALHGKGNMPARGGRSDFTDDEVKSAIQTMLQKSGASG